MTALVSDHPAPAGAFYGACQDCTAKWFSPIEMDQCPRCGSRTVLLDQQMPPWAGLDESLQDAVHGPEGNETAHVESAEIVLAEQRR